MATLVRLCMGAGARRVLVMDTPFGGTAESAYEVSGIAAAVRAAEGEMVSMHGAKFLQTAIPDGVGLQRMADFASAISSTLTVVDAVRILMDHGPTGGNLDDVLQANVLIASHDCVAADAQAAALFGIAGADISHVHAAAEMGLGTLDLASIKVEEITI